MNIIDIVIIVIVAVSVLLGYKKGFVKSIYSILSLLVTYLILFYFKASLITAIAESQIGQMIGKIFVSGAGDTALAKQVSSAVIYLASGIILYFVIKLILGAVLSILNTITSLPIINTLNKFLGLCIGIVIGLIWVVIVLNVLSALPETAESVALSQFARYFDEYMIFN